MQLYFLGIGGTLMGHLAFLAKQIGHLVSGMDNQLYPPMSDFLKSHQIQVDFDLNEKALRCADLIVVGNKMTRGHPVLEFCLDYRLKMISSAQYLSEYLLHQKQVIAISGTHGKTTITALVSWMLKNLSLHPSFLIAGKALNFDVSAFFSKTGKHFVIEADEYDTSFADKRSKFIHYFPEVLLINNLEFDHADIFKDLNAIQTQFHHLIRTLSRNATVIYPAGEASILAVLDWGIWSKKIEVDFDRLPFCLKADSQHYYLEYMGQTYGPIYCGIFGEHNRRNMMMSLFVAQSIGIGYVDAFMAMEGFLGVERRMQDLKLASSVKVYSDFAHHPTSVHLAIEALKSHHPNAHLHVLMFSHCNTLKLGISKNELASALKEADYLWLPQLDQMLWQWSELEDVLSKPFFIEKNPDQLVNRLVAKLNAHDVLLIMSNGDVKFYLNEIKARVLEKFPKI